MNKSGIGKIIGLMGLGILALYLTVDILSAEGNILSRAYLYVAICGPLLGMMASRIAVYVILILSVNVDLLKRLMVSYGRVWEEDLYWILGLAPLILSGIVINLFMSHVTRAKRFTKEQLYLFAGCTIICVMLIASTLIATGMTGRSIGNAINEGLYIYLCFVIAVLFPSANERIKILKFVIAIFIPVAMYMFYHYYVGLNQFEIDYLESGLSVEGRVLDQNMGAYNGVDGGLRGFSTMSGASVVSTMLSTLILLVMTPIRHKLKIFDNPVHFFGRLALACLFLLAAYFTITRKGWVCGMAAIGIYWFMKSKITIVFGYSAAIIGFLIVVLASPAIVEHRLLDDVSDVIQDSLDTSDSVTEERALVVGTMYDRFRGWANLTEGDIWTPFGFKAAGMDDELDAETASRMWGHDVTVDLLMKLGYIPCFLLFITGAYLLYQIHRHVLALEKGGVEQRLCNVCIAMAIGIAFGGFANAQQLSVFPQNLYVFLYMGIATATILEFKARRRAEGIVEASSEPEEIDALGIDTPYHRQ